MKKKTIGILGGMGPLATMDLYKKLILSTEADCDNDHIRVYIDGNAAIPDRTAAILHGGPDPVPEMLSALRNLEKCGADCVIMPCNTAHHFLPRLQTETALPILDMTAITAAVCAERYPGKTACLLGTTGTLEAKIYDGALERAGVAFIEPNEGERIELMRLIYDVVKASKPLDPETENWHALLSGLSERGADYFVLACTELPILADALGHPGPFVDPTLELARAAIRFCGYTVKNDAQIKVHKMPSP